MIYQGQCHCGKLKASFETQKTPAELGVRTCQCAFCRRHGAVNISDPEGEAVFDVAPDDLLRYRFGLRTADFLTCRHCGVYAAAVIGEGGEMRSTLNAAGLGLKDFLGLEAEPMEYGSESTEERTARRFRRWTPTRFIDPDLNASFYGPH